MLFDMLVIVKIMQVKILFEIAVKRFNFINIIQFFKDTHREKAPSNKTLTLTESRNMGIWVVGTSNQMLNRGS